MMNSQKIKDKLKNIAKEKNVDFNILLHEYMYERFLERLSISKYKNNFILKGGYYLSTLFGIENRATIDIDACLKNSELSKTNLLKMVEEIINIKIDDGAELCIKGIEKIRQEDEYGGFRIGITVNIDNIRETFHFDVATGDPITPKEITYEYNLLLENRSIKLLAYNLETVLAEKLETILTRGERSSRMKDYHDIYLIMNTKKEMININHLNQAIFNTFTKREFKGNIKEIFNDIKDSKILEEKWLNYKRRKKIKNIDFKDTIYAIEQLINIIKIEVNQ